MASRFGLVFGGCGALGKAVVQRLNKEGFKAISIDLLNNADAHNNILVRPSWSLHEQSGVIRDGLDDILGKEKVSSVFCAAGGWKGGSIRDTDFLQVIIYLFIMLWTGAVAEAIGVYSLSQKIIL